MPDIITKIYHVVDESLPILPLEYKAERALEETLNKEQWKLFEEYQSECFRNTEAERIQLFRYSLFLGGKLGIIPNEPATVG